MSEPPGGKPIPGSTNLGDTEWMLTRLRRWVFSGGDPADPRYREQLDRWLDYRNELRGTELERVGTTHELTPGGPAMSVDRDDFEDGPNPCVCPPEVIELLDLAVRYAEASIHPDKVLGAHYVKTFMEQPSEVWCRYISEARS